MICAEFKRNNDSYEVDAEYRGYGNYDIIKAFEMEGVNIQKILDNMKIGETKIFNIGWYPNCGIKKRGLEGKKIEFKSEF